jgi:hypothetical protein
VLQAQTRKEEFRCSISFLEVRISGENECIDSESVIFPHTFGDHFGIPDQSGAGTASDQPNTRPKVRTDLQCGA